MIAVRSSLTRERAVRLEVLQNRPSGPFMLLELHVTGDDLLAQPSERTIHASPHALNQLSGMTPFGREFLRRLFGPQPTGVITAHISPGLLTIVHERKMPFDAAFYLAEAHKASDAVQAMADALG